MGCSGHRRDGGAGGRGRTDPEAPAGLVGSRVQLDAERRRAEEAGAEDTSASLTPGSH